MNSSSQKWPKYKIIDESGNVKEIDESGFETLKANTEVLATLWHAENHYAYIGQTYKDFERTLFDCSFDMAHRPRSNVERIIWSAQEDIQVRLTTLLNTIYVYLNNLENSYIKKIENFTSEDMNVMKQQFSKSHDTRLEYRIMYSLRNFIIHVPNAKVPSSYFSKLESKRNLAKKPWRVRHTFNPEITLDSITKDRALKKSCREDILKMKQNGYDSFNVKFMLRGYIEEVAGIHCLFRKKTEGIFNRVFTDLEGIGKYVSQREDSPLFVKLIKFTSDSITEEQHEIGYALCSRLKEKRQEWNNLDREQVYYYSSGIFSHRKTYPQFSPTLWIT